MAKTPSLSASIREVGISPTLKSVWDDLCRIILSRFASTDRGSVINKAEHFAARESLSRNWQPSPGHVQVPIWPGR